MASPAGSIVRAIEKTRGSARAFRARGGQIGRSCRIAIGRGPATVTLARRALSRNRLAGCTANRFRLRALRAKVTVDRKSTRLNSSHGYISDAAFCFKQIECAMKSGTDVP